jgi:pilus assembly protein CpaB
MKPKTMVLMVVAVACGLVASYLTRQLIRAQSNTATQSEEMVQILVARQKIAPFVAIKEPEKMFTLVDYPERIAPKKALKDIAKVKDQRLNKFIDADKPVTEDDLLSADHAGLQGMMKPGQRAVAIKVNTESLVGGFVLPGARVDVVCTIRGADATAKVILQDMLVMAVDQTSQRNAEQPTILGQTIVMAATPLEANRLALATAIGELRLTLRGLGDNTPIGKTTTRISDLDKPLPNHGDHEPPVGTESSVASGPPAPPVPALGALPEEEPKEQPKKVEEAPAPVVVAEKPPRRHKMKIHDGLKPVETVTFVLGKQEDDEDEDAPAARTPEAARPAPAPKPAAAPPLPVPAAGSGSRSTRTGSAP